MKGNEIDTNENYDVRRFVTECGRVEYGLYRVMFGVRFRAGLANRMAVECDWCCGVSPANIALAFAAFERELARHDDPRTLFAGLPKFSAVKPFDRDPTFTHTLEELASAAKVSA